MSDWIPCVCGGLELFENMGDDDFPYYVPRMCLCKGKGEIPISSDENAPKTPEELEKIRADQMKRFRLAQEAMDKVLEEIANDIERLRRGPESDRPSSRSSVRKDSPT